MFFTIDNVCCFPKDIPIVRVTPINSMQHNDAIAMHARNVESIQPLWECNAKMLF